MFDFSKSSITGINISELQNNDLLKFYPSKHIKTGVILENTIDAFFKSWKIEIKNEYVNLFGSFHKYHNSGKHNHNDFGIKDLLSVLNDQTINLKVNPFLAFLSNLEFGVMVELPFNTKEFLEAIISYKGKEYQRTDFVGGGCMLLFKFDHYHLKIYDKGLQDKLGYNLLRFEIKVKKMEYFNARNIKISKYADLLNTTEVKKLIDVLLKAFNELLIYDETIVPNQFNKREKDILQNGCNPKYWTKLKRKSLDKFKYNRKRFRELVLKYGKMNYQQTVYELMKAKLLELTKTDTETELEISQYLNSFSTKSYPEITSSIYPEITTPIYPEITAFKM